MLGVDPKILEDCEAVELVAGASIGLLAPKSKSPKALDGAAVELLPRAED